MLNGIVSWLDRSFDVTERGSSIATEIRGGIITFISMYVQHGSIHSSIHICCYRLMIGRPISGNKVC
jgi:hypothetical protein